MTYLLFQNLFSKFKSTKIFFAIFFILIKSSLFASKPLTAVIGVKADNFRVLEISTLFENQLINVINSTGLFDVINPDLLKDQLTRFGCTEEDCIISFASTAKINLIIRGFVQDKGDSMRIVFIAQGINSPYYGRIVYKYSALVPLNGLNLSTREYNLISEEHSGYFISGLLKRYKAQSFIKINKDNKPYIESDQNINGSFDLYRYEKNPGPGESIRKIKKIGRIDVEKNEIKSSTPEGIIEQDDFIFITYDKKAEFLNDVFYGRKRELVFYEQSSKDTAILFLTTVPVSALMPVIAPLGYYKNGDFTGLFMWAINSFPYLYLEYDGLKGHIEKFKDDRQDARGESTARYKFGIYMLLCGGIPIVIDAFADNLLYLAKSYQGQQPYLGNNVSAVYLSLISGGGGHFYKGYRFQGYLYFHLHNILLYSIFKEFSASDMYVKESRDKRRTYMYLGAFGLLKITEIVHVLLIKDNIRNGTLEESYGLEPVLYRDNLGINLGMQYIARF